MSSSCVRLAGLTVAAVLAFASVLQAQDVFEQRRRELELQAQKAVADAKLALDQSRQLEKTNPAEAKALLNKNLLAISDASAMEEKQRADLRSRLLARLKEVDASGREQKAGGDFAAKAAADKAAREERERIEAAKFEAQGKSIYDQSKGFLDNAKNALDAQKQSQSAREKGFTGAMQDVDKSSAKMTEDRITEYFIAKSEGRKQKLSPQEAALLKALNSTISVDFNKNTLKEVLEYMSERTGINIFADPSSLKDVGAENYDTPVTFKANKLTVRTVLKKIFGDLGMTYVIKDGSLTAITPDRAKDYLVVRAYPVGDLVNPIDMRWGPAANRVQMVQQVNQLINMIVTTIEPASWQGASDRGYGMITFNEQTMTLIIRHTAEMHYMLGGGLAR